MPWDLYMQYVLEDEEWARRKPSLWRIIMPREGSNRDGDFGELNVERWC
jgi:hypothetical protein